MLTADMMQEWKKRTAVKVFKRCSSKNLNDQDFVKARNYVFKRSNL